jgi:molecular chaperone DnaK
MSTGAPIIGIDLGTTYTAVAVVQEGRPRLVTRNGERLLPSVVGISPQGKWLVGTPAQNQYVFSPENTVRSIKRLMGSAERITIGKHILTPQEVSAFILHEIKAVAESALQQPVRQAVITVPAYFSDAQRQATRDAGEIAGLEVVRIINEPTAAALAYGLNRADDQLVLVYDLGGGTFDVSLVELTAGVVEVRASHGDTRLGGDDFDARLAQHLARRFAADYGLDLLASRHAAARLLRAAEQAKITLSDHPFAHVCEEFVSEVPLEAGGEGRVRSGGAGADPSGSPVHMDCEVSRKEFEALIRDLLQRTLDSVDHVLKDAGLAPNDIDRVLLVGGSSRIPLVWQLLAEHTGREPQLAINPEEAVALGAAIQAAIIAGQPIGAVLVDVTPFSLGIEIAAQMGSSIVPDIYRPIIRRNTVIPTTREEVFRTVYPGQDVVEVAVYQGEHPVASHNRLLGRFRVTDLQPETPGDPARVTVAFDMDVNGILRVQATDRKTGQQKAITVTATSERLSADEISRATANVVAWLADEDSATDSHEFEPDEAAVMLRRAHQLLEAGTLDAERAEPLQLKVEEVEQAQHDGDRAGLARRLDELIDLLFELEA